jgi:hypothetical protein
MERHGSIGDNHLRFRGSVRPNNETRADIAGNYAPRMNTKWLGRVVNDLEVCFAIEPDIARFDTEFRRL